MIHELKTWPARFVEVAAGRKTFELRRFDRDFKVGDVLDLQEWDPDAPGGGRYTGRRRRRHVLHLLEGRNPATGLSSGFCIMSIGPLSVVEVADRGRIIEDARKRWEAEGVEYTEGTRP